MSEVFTVREITGRIKELLEGGFPFVWVRGQVTNLSRPASGHVYFTLKDEEAVLSAVWFKRSRMRRDHDVDPLTGEVFEPVGQGAGMLAGMLPGMLPGASPGRSWGGERDPAAALADGQDLLCGGRITVYPPRGAYQLRVELVEDMGLGRLHQEFEAQKQRFSALGYFDPARKRPLPGRPLRVAVVTAPGGAAIRDFLRLAGERGSGAHIRIYPSLVQGAQAGAQIAQALRLAGEHHWAQVVVLLRGGGSLEDLWAFNTQEVAEAIFTSPLPVLTGVGHEVDVTIADLAADLRAATPSHAAQLLWPERGVLEQELDSLEGALARSARRMLERSREQLRAMEQSLRLLSPRQRLVHLDERFAQAGERMARAMTGHIARRGRDLEYFIGRAARAFGPEVLERRAAELGLLARQWRRAGERCLRDAEQGLEGLGVQLAAVDPEGPLARGFALVRMAATGRLLRRAAEASPGQGLDIQVRDGRVLAQVTQSRPQEGGES